MTNSSDNMYNLILGIKEDVGSIKSTVASHDKIITDISHAVIRMESKQNEDMVKFIAEKETIYGRLKPLEDDYKSRKENTADVKKKVKDTAWDWAKMGVIFGAGYVLTTVYEMVMVFKK